MLESHRRQWCWCCRIVILALEKNSPVVIEFMDEKIGWLWPSMSTCALRMAHQAQRPLNHQREIPFHASSKMRILELKFGKVENIQWSWSWWCSKYIASMRLCLLRLLLWCRSSYPQLCPSVVKLAYMSMLATTAPIWKLLKALTFNFVM
jgi:hypothetical protein